MCKINYKHVTLGTDQLFHLEVGKVKIDRWGQVWSTSDQACLWQPYPLTSVLMCTFRQVNVIGNWEKIYTQIRSGHKNLWREKNCISCYRDVRLGLWPQVTLGQVRKFKPNKHNDPNAFAFQSLQSLFFNLHIYECYICLILCQIYFFVELGKGLVCMPFCHDFKIIFDKHKHIINGGKKMYSSFSLTCI
jgi:hypothetical protein